MSARNVLGGELADCGHDPKTGFFRDGCCHSDARDGGNHSVCAVVDSDFLNYSFTCGNDLITPRPEFGFVGLKPGDSWCLCAGRWDEARKAGLAPPVRLEATHERALDVVSLEHLKAHAAGEAT